MCNVFSFLDDRDYVIQCRKYLFKGNTEESNRHLEFELNSGNFRIVCEISLKLTRKIPERYHISYMIYGTRYHISLTLNAITFSLFTLFCWNLSHISQTEYFPDSFSFTNKHLGIHFMSFNDWVFQWKMSFSPDANK